ncbi:MAG: hypothetical protein Q9194_001064 [Teloschistes cf. exilis]
MAQGLPEGLLTTKEDVRGSIESVDNVEIEDIARLWKAFHANRAVLAEDVGRRLENFFWRLWGSDRLWGRINGNRVAAIFGKISEGGYIRTTPTQSPRSSRSLGTFRRTHGSQEQDTTPPSDSAGPTPNATQPPGKGDGGNVGQPMTESVSASRKRLPPRPSPILRRTKPTSLLSSPRDVDLVLQHRKDAAEADAYERPSFGTLSLGLAPQPNDPDGPTKVGRKPSGQSGGKNTRFTINEGDPRNLTQPMGEEADDTESQDTHGRSSQRTSRRKATMVANVAASKRKLVVRQRSLQSSSSSASVTSTPPEIEPTTAQAPRRVSSAINASVKTESGISTMLKRQRTQQEEPETNQETSPDAAAPAKRALGRDQDMKLGPRRQLSSRAQPSHPSLTSLPSILKKPSAATVTSAPYQASGTLDLGQQTRHVEEQLYEESMAESSKQPPSCDNSRTKQLAGGEQAMSRSKSQLALLLQKNRMSGGD